MLRARHNESFCAPDLVIKARDSRRSVIWKDIATKLRPKTDDEIHSSCRGPGFADRGDCRREPLAFLRIQSVKFQVRVRGRSKSEDSSLRCVHHASSELFRRSCRCFHCGYALRDLRWLSHLSPELSPDGLSFFPSKTS